MCDETENSYHSIIGQSLGTVLEDEDSAENEVQNEQDEDEDRMYVPGQPDRSYFEDDIQREFDELRQMGYSFGKTYKYLGDQTNFLSGSRPPEDENVQTEIPKLKSDDDTNSGLNANAKNFDKLGSSEETWKHYNEYNHDPDGTIDNGFMPHEQNFVTEIYETEEVPLPDYSEKAGLQSADEGSKDEGSKDEGSKDENFRDDTVNTDEGIQDEGEKTGENKSYVSLETAGEENGGKDEKDYYGYSQNDDTEANDFKYQNEDDLNDKETFDEENETDVEKENEIDVDDGNEDDEGEYDTEGANDEDDEDEYDNEGENDEDDEDEYDNEGENDEDDEDEFDSEGENDEDNEDEYDTRDNIDEDQDDSSEDALISDDSIVGDEVQKTKSYSSDLSSEKLTEEEEYALIAMLEGKVQFKESLSGWDVQSLSVPDTGGESLSSYSLGSTLGMMNGTLGSQKKFAKSSNGKNKRSV